MAEAHSAVAFSFSVTPEGGLDLNLNHEAIRAVWKCGLRSWRRRFTRVRNHFLNFMYPGSPLSWVFTVTAVLAFALVNVDPSAGLIERIKHAPTVRHLGKAGQLYMSCVLFASLLWLAVIIVIRCTLRGLLTYTGWMFEPRGKISLRTKSWVMLTKIFGGRNPQLYSYQTALPKLPVPLLENTMRRYLLSVQAIMDEEKYKRMENLVAEFKAGIGPKLQRYLILKSWWASNYVSDWWEEYVYLHGRSPIMVNSNFYGIDAVFRHPTTVQVARAANIIHAMLLFRRAIDREELKPILLNNTVPLCSWQYERLFNSTRIPGIQSDKVRHWKDSVHIAVYHKGRYFKLYIYYKAELLSPSQLEHMLQKIVDDKSEPVAGEEHLAALTAGNRIPWAKARRDFFFKGVNKASLDCIEKAAFVCALDDEPQNFDMSDQAKLGQYTRSMLHGKCYDRWFDKSFTLVVCSNGRIGFNAEHSWADAPIMAHMWESVISDDVSCCRYNANGHTVGEMAFQPPNPIRLQWDIPNECCEIIESSLTVARGLAEDVDLHLVMHEQYGKGLIKKCRISPDAFIQMALQLAYFRDAGKFCLTYEASMTRLYREGRTETVRSCTNESAAFVKAMEDKTKTNADRQKALFAAAEAHQTGYRNAMTGQGIDRHLFCLYVVSKYLGTDSPFLTEVLSEPWRLSTSQTPHQQTDKLDLTKNPELISAGGGFGPVADDGYGVSYIVAGEDTIFFHISSKRSCPTTSSAKFHAHVLRALDDMKNMFQK